MNGLFLAAALLSASPDSPAPGTAAPAFSLRDQAGATVTLEDFRGKWLVLYFYPKDFTSGCTREARAFQQDVPRYEELGAAVVGVSRDGSGTHRRFCDAEGLQFPLLADTAGEAARAYGAIHGVLGLKVPARSTFLIDPSGKVARVFRKVKPSTHSGEVLAAIRELRGRAP